MCGRYTLTLPWNEIAEQFGVAVPQGHGLEYNAAPGQKHPIITSREPGKLQMIYWGFPLKGSQKSQLIINARQDTLTRKALFREKLHSGRCIIPADGFYEWEKKAGKRMPVRFLLKNKGLFAFAGLFGIFKTAAGDSVERFTIITTQANELVQNIHDRMPLMLQPQQALKWLQDRDPEVATQQLQPVKASDMISYPVSPKVNNAANNSPENILPWTDPGLTLF